MASQAASVEDIIGPLRVTRRGPNSSGFRNVYLAGRNRDGNLVWKARVKRCRRLVELPNSRHLEPWRVALLVAQWYRETFGEGWVDVLKSRKRNPWRLRTDRDTGLTYAACWCRGVREEVVRLSPDGKGGWVRHRNELLFFPSRAAAKEGVRDYCLKRFGPDWRRELWRVGDPLTPRRVPALPGRG